MNQYKNQHFYDHFSLRNYVHSSLSKLELTIWLHRFGRSLIAVFIPILLYKIGFSIPNIVLFFLVYNLIDVPMNFVARRFIMWIGAKNTIILGIISEIAFFIIFYFTGLNWIALAFLALTWAIFDSFYWVAHWFILNECVRRRKGVGKQLGVVEIIRGLGGILAPAFGALLLIFLNKHYLIIISILFFISAIIPLSTIRLDYMKPKKKKSFAKFFKPKENKINFLSAGLTAFHNTTEGILLPLFVFLTFGSIGAVGALPVIASVASLIMIYFTGKLCDHSNKRFLIALGASLISIVWILRLIFPSIMLIYATTLIIGFLTILIMVPLDAKILEEGRKSQAMLETSTYRNASHMGANVILFGILYLMVEVFRLSFGIALGAMILLFLISLMFRRMK